jgi:DNA-binding NtrC family response regulator
MLKPVSVPVDCVADVRQARSRLGAATYPVILTETRLSDGTWIDVLELAHEMGLPSTVIVTDRVADDLLWAEVLNLGAYDLLVQPFDTCEVQRILSNACSLVPRKTVAAQTGGRPKRVAQVAL